MKKIKIILDKGICIDCGACISEAENYFTENFSENQSRTVHLKGNYRTNGEKEELTTEATEKQEKSIESAIDICPTQAIKTENE